MAQQSPTLRAVLRQLFDQGVDAATVDLAHFIVRQTVGEIIFCRDKGSRKPTFAMRSSISRLRSARGSQSLRRLHCFRTHWPALNAAASITPGYCERTSSMASGLILSPPRLRTVCALPLTINRPSAFSIPRSPG